MDDRSFRLGDHGRYPPRESTFETLSFLLTPASLKNLCFAHPNAPTDSLGPVDSLSGCTNAMWDVLTDVVVWEWYRIRIPTPKALWHDIHVTDGMRKLFLFDAQSANALSSDIAGRYLGKSVKYSMFDGYGLAVEDGLKREQMAMAYLARQSKHIRHHDQYVLIASQGGIQPNGG